MRTGPGRTGPHLLGSAGHRHPAVRPEKPSTTQATGWSTSRGREQSMKIAAVSEDGVTISQHFGRAPFYVVVTVQDGRILSRETRDKLGHAQFAGETHDEPREAEPRGHGFDPAAQDRHVRMAAAIADCEVLLARGMGAGAYESMRQAGIRPIVTDIGTIDDAVRAYRRGRPPRPRREAALARSIRPPGRARGFRGCATRRAGRAPGDRARVPVRRASRSLVSRSVVTPRRKEPSDAIPGLHDR